MQMQEILLHETNWLGSNLIFYNTVTGSYDKNINNVFLSEDAELDSDGFDSYVKYGFSVFGDTPIKNVKFTLPNTKLLKKPSGELQLQRLPDPILEILGNQTSEALALDRIEAWVEGFHKRTSEESILGVLPLSGGLDSRLLAYFSKNSSNLHAFSYGISLSQNRSSEVRIGKKVAESMGLKWQQIHIGEFHQFLNLNNQVYGPSTHAHSMYHFEFYSKIKNLLGLNVRAEVLSGIYGDVWAGSWKFPSILEPGGLKNLAVTHGIEASQFLADTSNVVSEKENLYFEESREQLKDPLYRVIAAARLKVMLLRHLIETPKSLGFEAASPFLDLEIAASMLTINPNRRRDRAWQRDFLEKNCPLGQKGKRGRNSMNVSDMYGAMMIQLPTLSSNRLTPKKISKIDTEEISRKVQIGKIKFFMDFLAQTRIVGALNYKLKFIKNSFMTSYADYVIMYPIMSVFGTVRERK